MNISYVEFLATLTDSISNYPNYENYVMSASALMRLQDTYDLETTSIAGGLVSSSAASSPTMSGTSPHTGWSDFENYFTVSGKFII